MKEIADFELKYVDCVDEEFEKIFDPDLCFDDVQGFLDIVKEKVQKQLEV